MCLRCDINSRPGLSRRGLIGALAAGAVATAVPTPFAKAAGPAPQSTIGSDEALRRLQEGNARYAANKLNVRAFEAERAARVTTHRPIASILGCADARVSPDFVFGQGPGALFVVRLAGNVVEEEGLASLEYSVQFLGSSLIFVMGHSNCGAVDAAIKVLKDNATLPGHLPELIDQIKPAVQTAQKTQPTDLLSAAIAENVRQSMRNLTAAKPILADMIAAGKLKVAGGVYDIATGKVTAIS